MKSQKRSHSIPRQNKNAPLGSNRVSFDLTLKLLHAVEHTRDVELPCEEAAQLFDQLAELVRRGEDPGQFLPLVQQHLEICADCREEFEALMRVLKASPA